jgi:uncharacterized membrane protein
MDSRIILGYVLLAWGIGGIIIALVTWISMWERKGMKVKIYWSGLWDFLSLFFMVGLLSFAWIGLNIYWHYDHKRIMRKIKKGKTSAKDLF